MTNTEYISAHWSDVIGRAKLAAEQCGRNFEEILVLAVSKTHPLQAVISGMEIGINDFGENYAQELKDKQAEIVAGQFQQPNWHFIGHLQTNKVKYLAPFVKMIHSVDTVKLAEEISKQAEKNARNIDILLQVNSSGEDSKSGCEPDEIFELAEQIIKLPNITVCGLMAIGSFASDPEISKREFTLLRNLRNELQAKHPEIDFHHLSMGMTNDFDLAIAEGATIVRVGTAIFGARDYSKK